jgi:hypothetical protein
MFKTPIKTYEKSSKSHLDSFVFIVPSYGTSPESDRFALVSYKIDDEGIYLDDEIEVKDIRNHKEFIKNAHRVFCYESDVEGLAREGIYCHPMKTSSAEKEKRSWKLKYMDAVGKFNVSKELSADSLTLKVSNRQDRNFFSCALMAAELSKS